MQAAEELQPQSGDAPPASFARMFSSLTAPDMSSGSTGSETVRGEAALNKEPLSDADALTYEGVLRRGAQFSRVDGLSADQAGAQAGTERVRPKVPGTNHLSPADAQAEMDAGKRRASVTLRLSRAECVQLKQRAAEAGLTVSAYIRSCTFEAETLRAQVKHAVQQLRGEQRGELRRDLRSETRGDWRKNLEIEPQGEPGAAHPEKLPPSAEPAPFPIHSPEARRRWWQLRPRARSMSWSA
jgi:hypothetical protein